MAIIGGEVPYELGTLSTDEKLREALTRTLYLSHEEEEEEEEMNFIETHDSYKKL